MENNKITPDGCIGVQVSSTRGEAGKIWEQRIIDEISSRTSYSVVPVQIPGMGAAAGGPGPDLIELIRNAFEIAGYIGAAWKSEQYIRRRVRTRVDKQAIKYAHHREYLHIVLTNGEPLQGSPLRPLSVRDLVAVLPYLRELLYEVEDYSFMIMGTSRSGQQINFVGLKSKDLRGRALRRMVKIADSEKGPVGYTSEDLNMFIFKPHPSLY